MLVTFDSVARGGRRERVLGNVDVVGRVAASGSVVLERMLERLVGSSHRVVAPNSEVLERTTEDLVNMDSSGKLVSEVMN